MRKRDWKKCALVLTLTLTLTGCGSGQSAAGQGSNIELIEPVNAEVSYETATRRTLYNAAVYPATVTPYIEEYSPEKVMMFGGYGAFAGDTVTAGQPLILTSTEAIDKQIEEKEKSIEEMEKAQQEYLEDMQDVIKEQTDQANYWKGFVDINDKAKPAEFINDPSGEGGQVKNPAYEKWESECGWVVGEYRIADHRLNTTKLGVEQKTALYELDLAHANRELEQLKENRREEQVLSGMDGCVLTMKNFYDIYLGASNYMGKGEAVVAVGDVSQKLLQCKYIRSNVIEKAQDVYALINGERKEVEFQPMDSEEYQQMEKKYGEGNVMSTLKLLDADGVEMGNFAVVVVISDCRQNVVTVPAGAIRKEEGESYVYQMTDSGNVYTHVRTGLSDGVFTEIIEGIEEGDKIVYTSQADTPRKTGSETAKVERGNFSTSFSETGYMEYPSTHDIRNPIENGTVYFVSTDLKRNQHVEKGDVLATVRVEADNLSLNRNEKKLARLRARLEDLEKKDPEENRKQIENYREEIEELQKTVDKQKADHAATQILADRSGTVTWIEEFEAEDLLSPDCYIATIAEEDNCYVVVEDQNHLLQFGDQVEIEYQNEKMENCTVTGTVVTATGTAVSEGLRDKNARIRPPKEEVSNMSMSDYGDRWWHFYRYTVKGEIRKMDNVPVVPKSAVWVEQGMTYVYVKDKDGNVVAQRFVAGGFNDKYYWVVEGLTEGTEICLE